MKLLLGTDGSDFAKMAEGLLSRIPFAQNGSVLVATAVDDGLLSTFIIQPLASTEVAQQMSETHEEVFRAAHQISDQCAERLRGAGIEAESVLLTGEIGDVLLNTAADQHSDLIVVGSRSEGPIRAFFLGSVARKVLGHSKCSVLLARHYDNLGPVESAEKLKSKADLTALVCVDESTRSRSSVEMIKRLPKNTFAKIVVLSVEPINIVPAGFGLAPFPIESLIHETNAQKVVNEVSAELAEYAENVIGIKGVGRPANVIYEKAREFEADLLVLGANRGSLLERALIGSVSYEVATEAPCSVLVVRPEGQPE